MQAYVGTIVCKFGGGLSFPGTFDPFHELSLSELIFLIGLTIVNINVHYCFYRSQVLLITTVNK